MRWLALLLVVATPAMAFTEAEVRAIAAHGPWPPAFKTDPSNRASGNPEAVELGERLFFDRRLSANGEVSCSRCHLPERNWSDGEARALGLARVDRNTPSLANARLASLRDVVEHYSNISPDRLHSDGEAILKPLKLAQQETQDLLAFLESLQDGGANYRRRAFAADCR